MGREKKSRERGYRGAKGKRLRNRRLREGKGDIAAKKRGLFASFAAPFGVREGRRIGRSAAESAQDNDTERKRDIRSPFTFKESGSPRRLADSLVILIHAPSSTFFG